ncbi:hypothetical protein WJX84_004726 [Apatococcus fuscideae]|uniref:Amino acid transporter transmembrane domain-containing protein n=1 Tax=Apatococcus fuscideae TaxID=2026836 RepID=A0AAW1T161_9CHLO
MHMRQETGEATLSKKGSKRIDDTSEIWVGHGANWFDVTCSTVTIMVGSGILHYPNAFAYLSWPGGVIYLTICLAGSLYSFWLLGNMHEMDGTRYITYRALGRRALGRLWGNIFVGFFQMTYLVGITIAHTVNAGQALKAFYDIVCSSPCAPYGLSAWIVTFVGAQLIFMQAPNFHSYRSLIALAAFCSIGYCCLLWEDP